MERILFVTGGAGGVGLETLQHQGTLRNSNGGSSDVLNSSLMRTATMSPPSDKLAQRPFCEQAGRYSRRQHNRAGHFGEKSDSGFKRSKVSTAGLDANSAATLLCGFGKPCEIQIQLNQ
jgi:hypothetical protein